MLLRIIEFKKKDGRKWEVDPHTLHYARCAKGFVRGILDELNAAPDGCKYRISEYVRKDKTDEEI